MHCIALHCIAFYCIVLYCIDCIVLYCIVLYCIVLYCIVLYCIVLYCIVSLDYLGSNSLHVGVIDACAPEENEERQGDQRDEDKAMAWKRQRPSALCTVCKSMYAGALISLLAATMVGALYMLAVYLSFRTVQNCQFYPRNSISIQTQWIRSMPDVISCAFLYIWFFVLTLFLFSPVSAEGSKKETASCVLCYIHFGCNLSCCSTSNRNIIFEHC